MNKILVAGLSLVLMACGSTKVAPITPPPVQEVVVEKPVAPKAVSIDGMTEYKGSTWSVSLPAAFSVVAEKTDDDGVQVKNEAGETYSFKRQATTQTTEEISNGIVYSLLVKGKEPAFLGDGMVMTWAAKEILYDIGDSKALALVVFSTGTNAYCLGAYVVKTQETVDTFKKVLASVKVSDVPVVVKPEVKSSIKK